MRFNEKIFRVLVSCILLIVFLFKISSAAFSFQKTAKTTVVFVNDEDESQENPEKKDDLKSSFNFNKEFDYPGEKSAQPSVFLVISNPHPSYQHGFIADHFPAVATPPPNI